MSFRQGQIWQITSRLSGETVRGVIVDSDLVADLRQRIAVAPVKPAREVPNKLQLMTAVLSGGDVVAVYDVSVVPKNSLTEHVGDLSAKELEQVKVALGARFDL